MPGYPESLLKNRSVVKHGNYAVITPEGRYWYRGGINPAAVKALIPASPISILCVVVPGLEALADLPMTVVVALGSRILRECRP